MVNFELIFVEGVKSLSRFIFLHVDVQLSQRHVLKRLSFFHWIASGANILKIGTGIHSGEDGFWVYKYRNIERFSRLIKRGKGNCIIVHNIPLIFKHTYNKIHCICVCKLIEKDLKGYTSNFQQCFFQGEVIWNGNKEGL